MARKAIVSSPEEKPTEPKVPDITPVIDPGYDYEKNRKRSLEDIARDAVKEPEKPKEETPPLERKTSDSPPSEKQPAAELKSPLEEAKEFVEKQKAEMAELIKKDAEEIAKKTLTDELQKIKDSELSVKEKKEAAQEAKAKWSGFDPKTGTPTPKDYDEIVAEARRLANEDFDTRYEARRSKEIEEYQKQATDQKKTQDERDAAQSQLQTVITNKINEELEELYTKKELSRDNEEMRQDLFRQAAAFNAERVGKNLPPIDSITRFYHNYYKKPEQKVAGGDAPIAGNSLATPKTETHSNYVKIHNSSFRDLAK